MSNDVETVTLLCGYGCGRFLGVLKEDTVGSSRIVGYNCLKCLKAEGKSPRKTFKGIVRQD